MLKPDTAHSLLTYRALAGAKQPTPTMSRRSDGGGNLGVRTENSKQQIGGSRQPQLFGIIVSPTSSVMQGKSSHGHEKHSPQQKRM